MIFIQHENRILKSSDTLKSKPRKNGIIKSWVREKQKIKYYASDKIENSAKELSEKRKK